MEKETRRGIPSHVNVRPAVVIQVGCYRRQSVTAGRTRYAGMRADIGEGSITVVVIETRPRRRQPKRTATHRNTLPVAITAGSGFGRLCKIEADVVGHEKIQVPVTIVVHPRAPGAPFPGRSN